jgi:4-aminobutyrate aminotransferase-like enzyme
LTDSHTDSGPDVVTYNDTIVGHLVAMDAIYEDYSTYAEQTSLEYVAKIEEKLEQSLTRIKEKQTTLSHIG